MKRRTLIILTTVLMVLSFNACGSSSSSETISTTQTAIEISTYCVSNPTLQAISTYTEIKAGDTVVRDENNTIIDTYSDSTGILRVCLVSGSAHIVR